MSSKNLRLLFGNDWIAIGLGILMAFSNDAWATRSCVKIANNTIVTDRGTLLRGARVILDMWMKHLPNPILLS